MKRGSRQYLMAIWRAAALALVVLSAANVAVAQTAGKKKKTFEPKLGATVTTLCVGTAIDLELELKNVSRRYAEIDKVDLWTRFYYSYFAPDGSGAGGGMAVFCAHCRGEVVALSPGATHWAAHKFSLAGEFFRRAGKYEISVSVESGQSNAVAFELIDCGQVNSEVTK